MTYLDLIPKPFLHFKENAMRKLLAVAIVALLLLAACSSPATPANPPGSPAAEPPTSGSTAAGQPIKINYMLWGSPEELAVWQAIVDDFEKQHPDISVTVDVSDWNSYWDKLQTLFAGGTPPDIFAMDGPLYPDWQSRGVLLNLQPYIDASPGLLDGLYAGPLETYKRADGYFGLPRDFQTIVLFYNKDMFDAAGVPYPTDDWTIQDLQDAAKKLTKDVDGDGVNDQWGLSTDLWDMELFWSSALWGAGGEVLSPDYTKTLIGEPKARVAWHTISDMVTVDKSIPDPETAAQYGDVFAAGKAAMTTIGHWVVPEYAKLPFKWDVTGFPAGPEKRTTSVNSAGFVISKDSKHADAAWEFMKFALSEPGQTRLTELGFALPVLKSVAQSPIYLKQKSAPIQQKVFLDALAYAKVKPSFRGYDEWATVVGDGLVPVWTGETPIDTALDAIVPAADAVLMKNK
jgi:multiple sugar transport system substrate-binding protein